MGELGALGQWLFHGVLR